MCYMRLWELEEGDGDEDDRARDRFDRQFAPFPGEEDENEDELEHEEAAVPQAQVLHAQEAAPQPVANPNAPPLEREGPLVLRINQLPPRPVPPAAPAVPEQQQRRQHRPPGRGRGAGAGRRAGPRFDERGEPMFDAPNGPNAQGNDEEARQRWVQMFVQMALNDEEDLVEWEDGEEDHARWEIPVGR